MCFKLHCSILKSLNSCNENEGSDSSLQQNIKAWKNTNDGTDLLTSAVLSAVLFVAENLIQRKAVLLPWACQIFLQAYCNDQTGSTSTQLTLEVGESSVRFTSQWLLNQLILHLNQYMLYKCMHKKFGTILYRRGGDILTSLSWALGSSRTNKESIYEKDTNSLQPNNEVALNKAAYILNDLLYEENRRLSASKCDDDTLLFDIDKYLQAINPSIARFLLTVTSTVHANLGQEFDGSSITHLKI